MTDLGTLGGASSSARGVNNLGQVVGWAGIANSNNEDAFLYSARTMHDLNAFLSASGPYSLAYAVNSGGQVVGYMQRDVGRSHLVRRPSFPVQRRNSPNPGA